jgi:hypothetical protein
MEARIKKSNTRELRIRTSETWCFLTLMERAILD